MFIFASYAGGLRVSDMLQLQWKHFNGEHIDFTIKKTGNQLSIKVPNKALAIIEKYIPTNENPNSFIFPMLPEGVLNLSATEIDNAISSATAYINKNLKLITKAAKIEKNISFHTSRHTWATRALRKGVSIDKVSKLMGHSAIKETQVYAKIVNSELDKAMDVFND
jgi:integrase